MTALLFIKPIWYVCDAIDNNHSHIKENDDLKCLIKLKLGQN